MALLVVPVMFACKADVVDDDDQQPKALRIPPGILVKDSIHGKKDPLDWKHFSYFEDARATVTFSFGDRFSKRTLRGAVTLFTRDGTILDRKAIVPENVDYPFVFDALKDTDYFFKIEATSGDSVYLVETRTEPLDPCAKCTGDPCCASQGRCCPDGTVCRGGGCVSADTCVPACREARGEVCDYGRCVAACPGGCRRGFRCDTDRRECVREAARAPAATRPAPSPPARQGACEPPCASNERCNTKTGDCESSDVIVGTVLSVSEEGGGAILLLNRGSQDGVRQGASGTVGGGRIPFRIINVSATRSRAKVDVPPSQIKSQSRATISK